MFTLPTIFDWLSRLEPLRGLPAVYALALFSLTILVTRDWRITLLALMGHYLLAGLLFAEVLLPHLAFVKVLTGLFVCLILYVTARQAPPAAENQPFASLRAGPLLLANTWPWRAGAGLLTGIMAIFLGQWPGSFLPGIVADLAAVNGAVYLLLALGLLHMSLTDAVWQKGVGFFLALTGFELFYNNLAQSPGILVAFTAVTLVISLAVAYLAQKSAAYARSPLASQ